MTPINSMTHLQSRSEGAWGRAQLHGRKESKEKDRKGEERGRKMYTSNKGREDDRMSPILIPHLTVFYPPINISAPNPTDASVL